MNNLKDSIVNTILKLANENPQAASDAVSNLLTQVKDLKTETITMSRLLQDAEFALIEIIEPTEKQRTSLAEIRAFLNERK